MQTRMFIYQPGSDEPVVSTIELAEQPGYDALKAIVEPHLDGGHLERVAVLFDPNNENHVHEGVQCDLFVDDDGMRKRLPVNYAATRIYHAASRRRNPQMSQAEASRMPPIYGVAVVFDRRVWF